MYNDNHAVLALLMYLWRFRGRSASGSWESTNAFIQRLKLVNSNLIVEF